MPFMYNISSKEVAENYTTSATPNTEIDAAFIKPGATRLVSLLAMRVWGKAAALTALSSISLRIKQWTTTGSSAGTAITPRPVNNLSPAAVATAAAGAAGGINAVTSGTGGPSVVKSMGCGASGPGGWVAINPDDAVVLDGNASKSIDLFSASPTASMGWEFSGDIQE